MEENIGYYYQQIFKKIFNISAMILEEYHNLETKNIDSNSLNKLKNLLTQEQEYYKMIKTNPDLLNGLLHKIAYFNKKTVDFIIPKNPNSLIYARISLKLSNLFNPNKSPEIFIVFNKFDLFSLIHYENILLALIFFQEFLSTYPNPILDSILSNIIYNYTFMFPYIEKILLENDFNLPNYLYSTSDYFANNLNVLKEEIINYKKRKAQQVKKQSNNNLGINNNLFIIFYLRTLIDDFDETLKNSPISPSIKKDLKSHLQNENTTKLIRHISFSL